ncbi:MAG: DUF1828 domain-containing protein [Bacteroidetes bacterium]|nr:DUF1828 domain-containing protein [Bacteroidota bacterium]
MKEIQEIKEALKKQFMDMFDLVPVRPHIYQILLPYYHPDGDIYEIFIEKRGDAFLIQDYGLTLMKMSYDVDVESDSKQELIKKILSENQVSIDDGNIYLISDRQFILPNLMCLLDTISKLSSLVLLTWKKNKNPFYETLEQFLSSAFKDYGFEKKYTPDEVPFADEYFTPHAITKATKPICIFPIASNDRCDQVTITVQHYLLSKFNPLMIGIYENMEEISTRKSAKVTNILDKQFPYLSKNESHISEYLQARLN